MSVAANPIRSTTPRNRTDRSRTTATAIPNTFNVHAPGLGRTTLQQKHGSRKIKSKRDYERDYHRKYNKLSVKYGAPLVIRGGIDSRVYQCEAQQEGVEFDKMQDIEDIHLEVANGLMAHEHGLIQLKRVDRRKPRYRQPARIFAYGIACTAIGMYAFNSQPLDLPPIFVLGCILGWVQIIVTPRSKPVSDLFPFLAGTVLAVVALALSSYTPNGVQIFCWTSIAEGTLAIILPAYTMLVAVSEILSRRSACGAARFISTVFYTIMMSFGMGCGKFVFDLCARSPSPEPASCINV